MTPVSIESNNNGRFTFSGELNRNTVSNCWPDAGKVLHLAKKNNQQATLDLAKISHIDTAGLAWLVNLIAEQKQLEQPLSLVNCPDSLLKLAKISDVDGLLPLE